MSAPPPSPSEPVAGSAGSPRTLVLGVLGGIASGKSTVAALLAGANGLVLAADAIAHEVLASPEVTALVRARFGPDALGADGLPDRQALARRVFDPVTGAADRRALEGWTHPRVRATIARRLDAARAAGVPRVVLDVPLLLENDPAHRLVGECDALVFVDVPLEERLRRAAERGWAADELARREAHQLPLEAKRDRATHVVRNDSDRAALESRVRALLEALGQGRGFE